MGTGGKVISKCLDNCYCCWFATSFPAGTYDYLNMANYPNDADGMSKGYEDLFLNLLKAKKNFNINDRKKKYRNIFLKEKFIYRKYNND